MLRHRWIDFDIFGLFFLFSAFYLIWFCRFCIPENVIENFWARKWETFHLYLNNYFILNIYLNQGMYLFHWLKVLVISQDCKKMGVWKIRRIGLLLYLFMNFFDEHLQNIEKRRLMDKFRSSNLSFCWWRYKGSIWIAIRCCTRLYRKERIHVILIIFWIAC